ncbi:hypothetical protein ES703_56769 [subsurface metagenome]
MKLLLTIIVIAVASVVACIVTTVFVSTIMGPISGFGFRVAVDCDSGQVSVTNPIVETNLNPLYLVFIIAFVLGLILWFLAIEAVERWS